jgi:hypothetical protein
VVVGKMKLSDLTEKETLDPPSISIGDEIKIGKFLNKKAEVTGFTKDDRGQPVLKTSKGDQRLFKPRIVKLDEGRDAPLYHGTDMIGLIGIIRENTINGSDPSDAIGYKKTTVRLSRDINVAKRFSIGFSAGGDGGILELDQTKLSHNYKLVPFVDSDNGALRDLGHGESEEVVMTTAIHPLSRYLIAIHVSDANIEESLQDDVIAELINHELYGATPENVRSYILAIANHPLRKN